MHSSIRIAALAAGLMVIGAAPGLAAGAQLSPDQIKSTLEAAGYTNVHDIEYDDGRYEAEATSAAGTAVDLDIDPTTGKVTQEKPN